MRSVQISHSVSWVSDSYVMVITFSKQDLVEWCLSLAMLFTGVVDVLVLSEPGGAPYLRLKIDEQLRSYDRGIARLEEGQLRASVSKHEVVGWMTYYLTYYRDGVVGADHIDVDLLLVLDDPLKEARIVFMAEDVGPPLTLEEAQALMND